MHIQTDLFVILFCLISSAADVLAQATPRQLTINLTDRGVLSITDDVPKPLADSPPITTKLGLVTNAVIGAKDNIFTIAYDFADPKAVGDFPDAQADTGAMAVKPNVTNTSKKKFASVFFPRRFRLPLTTAVMPASNEIAFAINFKWTRSNGQLFWLVVSRAEGKLSVEQVTNNNWAGRRSKIVPVKADESTHLSMRLDKTDLPVNSAVSPQLTGDPDKTLRISSWSAEASLTGYFGIGFSAPEVTVDSVLDGPGQSAGIKAGDVVTSINSARAASPADALKALTKTSPGDKVVFTVKREGKLMSIPVVAQ